VAQSFAAPLKPKFLLLGVHDSLDATLTHRFHKGAAAAPPMSAMKSRCFTASGLPCFDRKVAHPSTVSIWGMSALGHVWTAPDWQEWAPSTASKADKATLRGDVRFTPESGHCELASICLLNASRVPTRRNKKVHGERGGLAAGTLGQVFARQPHEHARSMPPVISTIVMLRLFARRQRASMSAYFTNSLRPPTGLGLLASPRAAGNPGRAARGSVVPRKMACRPAARGETFHSRFKTIDSRKRGGPVAAPF